MEIEIIGQSRAVFCVNAIVPMINADTKIDRTAFFLAGLADQLNDAACAVGCEGSGCTTANRFNARKRGIRFVKTIGWRKKMVAEQEDRKTVFLQ